MWLLLFVMCFAIAATTVQSFLVASPKRTRHSYASIKKLGSQNDEIIPSLLIRYAENTSHQRIVRVGGGIAIVPTGNNQLFDPELEGKLKGTGQCPLRVQLGYQYKPVPPVSSSYPQSLNQQQDLEDLQVTAADEWLEDLTLNIPLNFAKPTQPATATLLARSRIISNDAPGDIQHVILKLPTGMHYVEGQSISILPPGIDPKTKKSYSPRLYSIASTRYGDTYDGTTVSLCVRRAEYYDPNTGTIDSTKKGICSNFLCDALPGTTVQVAGPVGKTMLLPSNPNVDIIMIATGTGIAPFRGFLHRLFMEQTVARHMFTGTAWLILGVPTTGGLLYKDELDAMISNAQPGQLKVDYAISREMTNPFDGGKLYVQHIMANHADEFFTRLDHGANVYFCGLKGMMPPILETLEKVAASRGVNWEEKQKGLKANNQWHVEVY